MAKSSKASRGSAARPGALKRPRAATSPASKALVRSGAAPRPPKPSTAGKKSMAVAKKPKPARGQIVRAKPEPAPRAPKRERTLLPASSPHLQAFRAEEQRALRQAFAGKPTLLESSPRARDAVLFAAAASLAQHPVLVASPLAAELFAQAS